MRRFRFRIGSLLIFIVFLGVGFAALREANDLAESIVLTLAIGVLMVAVLLATHRNAERRAFWIGFALFGGGYLGLIAIPSIEPRLLTTRALTYVDSQLPDRPSLLSATAWVKIASSARPVAKVTFGPQGVVLGSSDAARNLREWSLAMGRLLSSEEGTTEDFVRIGHSLFALILAWLGGSLSRRLDLRSRRTDPLPSSVEASGVE